jgi:predicted nucleic acid-binding protein
LIVVDTTVLVYAVGDEHPLREPSVRLLTAIGDGRLEATTTVEVIQEFAHARARRRTRADAASLARDFAQTLSPLLVVDHDTLDRGLTLFAQSQLGAFDAVLAAAALTHEADAVVSADQAFASVPRLNHVVPGTAEFERLLAA